MKRKFNYKTLPMLIAALTVADYFEQHKEAFVNEMPAWDDPYIANFQAAVELILAKYFGIKSKEDLQKQTRLVNELTVQAREDLEMVKTQIERGFRTNPHRINELMKLLGYKEFWNQASHNNQSMMIGLLLAFSNHLDAALRAELEENQVNAARLTNILSYAGQLNQANVTQESLKGSSKLDTQEAVTALNNIYDQAIDICSIAKKLFKKDKLKRELFVFSRIVKSQGMQHTDDDAETETPAEANANP